MKFLPYILIGLLAVPSVASGFNIINPPSSGGDMTKAVYDTGNNGKIDANKLDSTIDAALMHDGTISNTEFGYMNGLTGGVQGQLDAKEGTLTNSAGLLAALNDETGTGLALFGTSPTIVTPTIASTGFTGANHAHAAANSGGQLTGTAAVIWGNWKTFYSNGSGVSTEVALGAQYTLLMSNGAAAAPTYTSTITGSTINFSAAANLQVGGAQIDFDDMAGTANIATTGTIAGHVPQGADVASSPVNLNTTDLHGKMYKITVAATVNLDAAADAGFGACVLFRVRDAAEAAIIDIDGSDKINFEGTALAAGVGITATGAGEFVSLCATTDADGSGTDGWDVFGHTTGWASQ